MPYWPHDGLQFHYRTAGAGLPFVFQHGLGGDVSQPFGLFQPPDGVRLLAFDCRGHGETRPLGPEDRIGIGSFADDLTAFLDFVDVPRAVVGGTSMGAAVALNFALRRPDRVLALDALYVNAMLLLLSIGIRTGSELYVEAGLIIALLGFAGTLAFSKFLLRGEVIE